MKVIKKIFNVFIDILIVLILIVSAIILTLSLTSKGTGTPNFLGFTLNSIQTASMEPEMYAGDLVIGKSTPALDDYDVNDIVFFQSSAYSEAEQTDIVIVKCHRIVEKKTEEGKVLYLTKGDNNKESDEASDGWIDSSKIIGIYQTEDYQGTKISNLGAVIDFLQNFWGFFFVIVLPMIIFFIFELVKVIMNLMAYSKEKALVAANEAAKSAELSEEQKRKAIEEYLASQQAKDDASPTDEKSE